MSFRTSFKAIIGLFDWHHRQGAMPHSSDSTCVCFRDHDQFAFSGLNTAAVLKSWVSKGADREKIVVGVPFYGRSFTLTSVNQNEPGDASFGPGAAGEYTNEEGFLSYFEICSKIGSEPGWKTRRDSDGNVYAFRGDQWVGFDTEDAVERKVCDLDLTLFSV